MENDLKERGQSTLGSGMGRGGKKQTRTASVAESQMDRHKYVQQQSRERDDVYGRGPLVRTAGSNLDCVHRVSYIHALEK